MAVHIRKSRITRLKMVLAQTGGSSSSQISPLQKGGQQGERGKSTKSTHKPKYHLERPSKLKCSKSAWDGLDTFVQAKFKRHSIHSMAAIAR